jgi:hypothetical protein
MATENLKFKIELFATFWDKPPSCDILVGDQQLWSGEIKGTKDKPDLIEFTAPLEEGKSHSLLLKRYGKDGKQCVVNDKGDILKDQLLHISRIEIDEIDIGSLVYEGVYTPEYPEPWASQQAKAGIELPKDFKNVTEMGHNGTWKFTFESPFYMWLLENLY